VIAAAVRSSTVNDPSWRGKQYKHGEKLLEKAYFKYPNISDIAFCIGGQIPYIKINFLDSRFYGFVTIIVLD
jgi:hypothetical protein